VHPAAGEAVACLFIITEQASVSTHPSRCGAGYCKRKANTLVLQASTSAPAAAGASTRGDARSETGTGKGKAPMHAAPPTAMSGEFPG
jgi:hypothetical protein